MPLNLQRQHAECKSGSHCRQMLLPERSSEQRAILYIYVIYRLLKHHLGCFIQFMVI